MKASSFNFNISTTILEDLKHLGNKKADKKLFNDVLQRRPKFVCFNSMNQCFKEILPKVMKEIL